MSWSLWTRRPHHADLNWMREGVLCISWSVRFFWFMSGCSCLSFSSCPAASLFRFPVSASSFPFFAKQPLGFWSLLLALCPLLMLPLFCFPVSLLLGCVPLLLLPPFAFAFPLCCFCFRCAAFLLFCFTSAVLLFCFRFSAPLLQMRDSATSCLRTATMVNKTVKCQERRNLTRHSKTGRNTFPFLQKFRAYRI